MDGALQPARSAELFTHPGAVVAIFQFFWSIVVIEWLQTNEVTPEQQRTVADAHLLLGASMQQHLAMPQRTLVEVALLIDCQPAQRCMVVAIVGPLNRCKDRQRHVVGQIKVGKNNAVSMTMGALADQSTGPSAIALRRPATHRRQLAQGTVRIADNDLVESGVRPRLHVRPDAQRPDSRRSAFRSNVTQCARRRRPGAGRCIRPAAHLARCRPD
ncbi:hypothetical protein C8F00_2218 [Xanthomonas vasicola]